MENRQKKSQCNSTDNQTKTSAEKNSHPEKKPKKTKRISIPLKEALTILLEKE